MRRRRRSLALERLGASARQSDRSPQLFYHDTQVLRSSKSNTQNNTNLAYKLSLAVIIFVALGVSLVGKSAPTSALAPNTINFQARLMNSSGSIVPDGNYNVEFKIYNAAGSSGSSQGSCTGDANCLWTETRTGGNVVTVSNGYLTVNLGSVTALPTNIWNQQLWLSMRIGGIGTPSWDTEMSPKLSLTAVPAAYSLVNTNGSNSASLTLQAPTVGNQNFVLQDQGAGGTYNLCIQNSAACGFAATTGASGYIQNGTSAQTGASFFIQPTSGNVGGIIKANGADTLRLQDSSGNVMSHFDASGNLAVGTASAPTATLDVAGSFSQTSGSLQAFRIAPDISPSSASSMNFNGATIFAQTTNSGNITGSVSGVSIAGGTWSGGGSIARYYGIQNQVQGFSGNITTAYGYRGSTFNSANISTLYGVYLAAPVGAGTITNNYALVTEAGAGKVGIGTITPGAKLEVDADASGIGQIIKANATTPGDLLQLQNSSGNTLSKFNSNGDLQIGGTNSAASTVAFTVQEASGAALLTADTTNGRVVIGSTSSSADSILQFVNAGIESSGPNDPSAATNNATVGVSTWSAPTNVFAHDVTYATNTVNASSASQYLAASGFGFNVPSGATIVGVKAEVERKGDSASTLRDNSIKLIKGGSVTGSDKADTGTFWPTSEAYASYGSVSDLWGTTLTPPDVNAGNFGVAVSVFNTHASFQRVASLDHVRVTVYYTEPSNSGIWSAGTSVATGQYRIAVGSDLSNPVLSLNSNGNASFSGNVGIGATSPSAALEVNNYSGSQVGLVVRGSVGQSGNLLEVRSNPTSNSLLFSVDSSGAVQATGGITSQDQGGGNITPLTLISSLSQSVDILTVKSSSGTSYLTVDNTGRVGVGTGTPGAPLEIANSGSDYKFSPNSVTLQSATGSVMNFTLSKGTCQGIVRMTSSGGDLSIGSNSGCSSTATTFTLQNNGNIVSTGTLQIGAIAGYTSGAAAPLRIDAEGSLGVMRITSTGVHVLGNTNPNYALDVQGDINASGFYRLTNSTFNLSLNTATLSANRSYTFPYSSAATDTICLQTLGNCAGGGGSYINNGTSVQTGNLNIQGAAAGNVVAAITGNASQSVDILDVKTSLTDGLSIFSNGTAQFKYQYLNGGEVALDVDTSLGFGAGIAVSAYDTAISSGSYSNFSGFFQSKNSGNGSPTLVTKQNSASTDDLFQVQNASGVALSGFNSAGSLFLKSGSNTVSLNTAIQANAVALTIPADTNTTDTICLQTLANCASGGSGDNVSVNGTAATDANFINTTATGTVAGTTWTLNTGASPNTISVAVGTASTSVAGIITTGTQSIAGAKTLTGKLTVSAATTGLAVTGAPAPGTGITSLLQIGSAIVGGNSVTSGGTYLGLNAPSSGNGSAADFLNFQKAGVSELKVTNSGTITTLGDITASTGTVTAGTLQVNGNSTINSTLNVVGNSFLAQTVNIGAVDGTGYLLNLDTKNTAGDPTGTDGGMYYNSNAGKFRCYQGGAWTDCIGAGGGSGVTTLGALDGGTANANGASISGATLYLQSATASVPGLVNTGSQTFQGDKLFNSVSGNFSVEMNDDTFGEAMYVTNTSTSGQNLYLQNTSTSGESIYIENDTSSGALIYLENGGTGDYVNADSKFVVTAAGQLQVTATPIASATSSLIQIGNAIAGGNSAANGGTYIGLNAPSSGAGSAADFLNFQLGGASKLSVTNAGDVTAAGNLQVALSTSIGGQLSVAGSTFVVDDSFNTVSLGGDTTVVAGKSLTVTGGITGTRPASPTKGMLYFDTTTNQLIQYNGTKWVSDHSSATKIVAASNSSQAEKDAADYVATGTDDGNIVNTALTAASGGSVYLIEGTYKLASTHPISIPNNTTLAGAGAGTIITIPNAQNGSYKMITNTDITTGTGVTIRDLTIDGNTANQTSGTMFGIYFNHMGGGSGASLRPGGLISNVTVKNVRGVSNGNGAIHLTDSSNNTVQNIQAINNTGDGIEVTYVSLPGSNNIITGNTAQGNGYGISIMGGTGNTVTGNVAQGNSEGIFIEDSYNSITGNTVRDNSFQGIENDAGNNTLTGNTVTGNGWQGLYIGGSSNTITGNNLSGNGDAGNIFLLGNNNTVSGNKVTTGTVSGITAWIGSSSNTITGNDITCNTTCFAIDINDTTSSKNYLADNRFSTTSGSATINDAGTGTVYANQARATDGGQLTVRTANNSSAFAIQNAAGSALLTADTSGNNIVIGKAGTLTGTLQLANATGSNVVGIQAAASSAAYTLTLPSAAPSTGQCLQTGSSTATLLQWGSCGGSGGANTSLSNLASTAVNADIVPDTDNTWMLGTSSLRWKDVYVGPGSLHVGTNGNEGSISYDTANQKLLFSANGTTGLSVASNGNVGFGTGTPSSALEVRQGNPVTMTLTAATNPSNTTAFGGVNFQSFDTQSSPWSVAYDSTLDTNSPFWSEADAIVLDPVNNILYSSGNSSGVYRCDVAATSCDATADWVKVSTASATKFIFDSTNNTIYGSSQYGNSLVTCAVSTACDASGDWHTYTAVSAGYFNLQAVDGANHKLYASHYDSSPTYLYHMYVCDLTTACDATTDWTQYDLDSGDTYLQPKSMVVDSSNGIVNVSAEDMDGYMYRCAVSSGCDATADWTKISTFDNFNGAFTNMQYDSATQSIYAGDTYGEIFRCAVNTACDTGSEWAYVTYFPNSSTATEGFSYSSVTGLLYAVSQGGGTNANGAASQVMSCAVTSNCDASADWSVQYTYPDVVKNMNIAVDNSGAVYSAGGEGSSPYKALIYRNGGSYVPQITNYGQIGVVAVNSTNTQESGALTFGTINNGTTAEGMRLQGGQLGIGTTAPGYKLDVQDSQASNYVMRIKNTSTANTADGLLIDLGVANASRGTGNYFIGFSGGGTVAGKIQGGASAVAYTTSAADYAEYFKADPAKLPAAGELVMLDTSDDQTVKATAGHGDFIAGVVSTNPGFVGNGPICKVDDQDCDSDYAKYNVLVSMVGQVPVKVNMAGGTIKPGDPIGASDIDGEGMKVSNPGTPIVGYALSKADADGTVTVLVRPGVYNPTGTNDIQGTNFSAQNLNVSGDTSLANLTVTGKTTMASLTVQDAVVTMSLTVNGHIISGNSNGNTTTVAGAQAGTNAVVTVTGNDTAGTITITTGAQTVQTDALGHKTVSGDNPAAGALATVTFAKGYGATPTVVLTPANAGGAGLGYYYSADTASFTLNAANLPAANTTYTFSYHVIQ